jgi:hypothetical protein
MLSDYLQVNIKTETLVELLEQGLISGADVHCSDQATKALIQEVCLKACIKKICSQCDQHEDCGQVIKEKPSSTKEISFFQSPPSHLI